MHRLFPSWAVRGVPLDMQVTIHSDDGGAPWTGTAPLEVRLRDPSGHAVAFGGPAVAVHSRWRKTYRLSDNAPTGIWTLVVQNLADGRTVRAMFEVRAD